jgi:hypothetical protein
MMLLVVLVGLALLGWAAQHHGADTAVGRDWQRSEQP